mmetsp:Transcript_59899/g.147260  ORF Transcript_59899/g.147260 Transcript_59899/m.147260 type:complete len:94 (-) Transcript_59899:513-794(-)
MFTSHSSTSVTVKLECILRFALEGGSGLSDSERITFNSGELRSLLPVLPAMDEEVLLTELERARAKSEDCAWLNLPPFDEDDEVLEMLDSLRK